MTKSELIDVIASKADYLSERDAYLLVNLILERMSLALVAREHIELRGFGTFTVRRYGKRDSRNPRNGEIIHLEPKAFVRFRPGKAMVRAVMYSGPAGKPAK